MSDDCELRASHLATLTDGTAKRGAAIGGNGFRSRSRKTFRVKDRHRKTDRGHSPAIGLTKTEHTDLTERTGR